MREYESLLRTAGFNRIEFFAPYPDYRLWSTLVPLDPPQVAQFYLNYLQEDFPNGTRERQVQSLEMVASQLSDLENFVNSYAILAWK